MVDLIVDEAPNIPLIVPDDEAVDVSVSEAFITYDVPAYEGSYSVTPSSSVQTLETDGLLMTNDVTVAAIPPEYIIPSGSKSITANGNGIDVASYATVDVAVPGSTPTGTKQISVTANGTTTTDVSGYASAEVTANVPNTYAAGDEGKVVSNGELVAQTSDTVTANGTYDTTLKNSVTVNVASGYTAGEAGDHSKYTDETITIDAQYVYPYSFMRSAFKNVTCNAKRFTDTGEDVNGVGSYVFARCTNLESLHLPNLTTGGTGGYQCIGCTKLTDVYMPKASPGQHMFDGCTSLEVIAIPRIGSATTMNTYGFTGCTKLKTVDLGNINKLNGYEFNNCSMLTTLILRLTSIVALSNVNNFNGSPFRNGGSGGTIYIPKSLYDHLGDGTSSDYQHATNWSTVYGYGTITWAKIEGSQYENYYADGRPLES